MQCHPGADINPDHNMVAEEMCIEVKKTIKGKKRWDMDAEKLKDVVQKAQQMEEVSLCC